MSKAVLISIKPKWCKLIASGRKTIEVRKTRPKLETPFKCYIYCTLAGSNELFAILGQNIEERQIAWNRGKWGFRKGNVIGEFVCDCILSHCEMANADIAEQQGRIRREDLLKYSEGKELYGWHISDLKIYDKAKELIEFYRWKKCDSCERTGYEATACIYDDKCKVPAIIERAPQSWCYVEEL